MPHKLRPHHAYSGAHPHARSANRHASPPGEPMHRRSAALKERLFGAGHRELSLNLFASGRLDHEIM